MKQANRLSGVVVEYSDMVATATLERQVRLLHVVHGSLFFVVARPGYLLHVLREGRHAGRQVSWWLRPRNIQRSILRQVRL